MLSSVLVTIAAHVAYAPSGSAVPAQGRASSTGKPFLFVGAARVNITPFTLTDDVKDCRRDPECPYHDIVKLSNAKASNPDGLPGGLFEEIGAQMAGPAAAGDWIGPTGVWGEAYTDANGNGRRDAEEPFVDDPANNSPNLGDPQSSAGVFDGTFLSGYGSDRQALGAFDPVWARAIFIRDARRDRTIAWISVDFTGYFSDFKPRIRSRLPDDLVDRFLLSHTHNHEGPDVHVGLWGADLTDDGTYPRYEIYVEAKIAEAINEASKHLEPALFRSAAIRPGESFVTPNGNLEDLTGMMSRNSCRTPWFFDDELRIMQMVSSIDGDTIATVLNWGAHVESMDAHNQYISSDFPHAARALVEEELGGTALYVPSAQGAGEIIGDSCTERWHRETFDGETFEVSAENGEPAAFSADPYDPVVPRDRTYAIGRVIGAAAVAAVTGVPFDPPDLVFTWPRRKMLCFPVNNEGLLGLVAVGVIDKPLLSPRCTRGDENRPPERGKTSIFAFRIGSASFVTAPGELAPELYYGVERINRSKPIGDYVKVNLAALQCAAASHHSEEPGAHSDRPYEPSVRDAQEAAFGTRVDFLLGYTPDLLGYIVPGYDFYWHGGSGGFGVPVEEAADPCAEFAPDLAFPDALYGSHYQETNSAGSMLGPAVTCEIVRLLGDPLGEGDGAACVEWDFANLTGRPPDQTLPFGYEPGCLTPEPPDNDCLVRHY